MQKTIQRFMNMRWAVLLAFSTLMLLVTGCGNSASEEPAAATEQVEATAPESTPAAGTAGATDDTSNLPPVDTTAANKPVGDKQPPKAN